VETRINASEHRRLLNEVNDALEDATRIESCASFYKGSREIYRLAPVRGSPNEVIPIPMGRGDDA
jgi:hypothetical protein